MSVSCELYVHGRCSHDQNGGLNFGVPLEAHCTFIGFDTHAHLVLLTDKESPAICGWDV